MVDLAGDLLEPPADLGLCGELDLLALLVPTLFLFLPKLILLLQPDKWVVMISKQRKVSNAESKPSEASHVFSGRMLHNN